MLNARKGASFCQETFAQECRFAAFEDECLERIARPERQVFDFIHLAHSADADAPDDAVAANCRIRKQCSLNKALCLVDLGVRLRYLGAEFFLVGAELLAEGGVGGAENLHGE